jgi:uncharacterized membrane protein
VIAGWLFVTCFVATLGSAVMTGLFFTFSVFMMRALASLPPAQGIAAMQAVNVKIITPLFLLTFLGTALASAVISVAMLATWPGPSAPYLIAGSALYLLGVILVTMAVNVPKNNALDRLVPADAKAASAWHEYVRSWTAWNHVRSVASLAATACFVFGLHAL